GITTYAETRHFDGDRNAVRRAGTDYAINRVWHYHNILPRHNDR
ncbi:MAG: Ompetence-damaged protein, partial [Burkholderia sp.]|nr:Ompetence-damaged protein [Burkholderia sp.]